MPGNAVEIDTSAVDRLSLQLASLGSDMKANTARRILKNIGVAIKTTIEKRYANRGPNNEGLRWTNILLASEMRRANKRIPKDVAKKLYEAKKQGRTTIATGAPLSSAKPLVTTNAKPQAVVSYEGDAVHIAPNASRVVQFGKHRGEPIDAFASPPEISGFERTSGTQPNRSAYFLSSKDELDVIAIAERILAEDLEKGLNK